MQGDGRDDDMICKKIGMKNERSFPKKIPWFVPTRKKRRILNENSDSDFGNALNDHGARFQKVIAIERDSRL